MSDFGDRKCIYTGWLMNFFSQTADMHLNCGNIMLGLCEDEDTFMIDLMCSVNSTLLVLKLQLVEKS